MFGKKRNKAVKLNDWLRTQKIPTIIKKKFDPVNKTQTFYERSAIMEIGNFSYSYYYPFVKLSHNPRTDQTFYQFLKKAWFGKRAILSKIAKWMEKDLKIPDIKKGYNLSFIDKDLHTLACGSRLFVAQITDSNFQMILVMENYYIGKNKRSLLDVATLINVLCEHEHNNFTAQGYELLGAFGLMKDENTIAMEFNSGKDSAYIFLRQAN